MSGFVQQTRKGVTALQVEATGLGVSCSSQGETRLLPLAIVGKTQDLSVPGRQ